MSYKRSVFPEGGYDTFIELYDLPPSYEPLVLEFAQLRANQNKTPEEEARFNELTTMLQNYILDTEKWNKFCDAVTGLQKFFLENTQGYIDGLKTETRQTVDNGKVEINTTKDNALVAIENKKDNIIAYMDETTAGAIRNDIGVMGDSTIEGRSLVDKTNLLKTQVDTNVQNITNNSNKINNLSTDVDTHQAEKATQTILGHVKAGKNVTIQIDGTLDVDVDTMIKFNRNPTSDDIDYDTGQLWFNEDTGNIYVLFKIDKDGSAIWRGVNNTELIYPLKIYGVRIDMNNSNPLTSVVYTDDAVNMTPAPAGGGISEWDNVYPYSEIKPCLLRAGEVQTYLNPNNLAQKADGAPADITTGDNGDVMVEFPVIYWKIWREGQYLYVKYANYKIDSTWKALAHTKGSTLKDNIYIGAFLGHELNGKLRSLSGKTVTANKTIGDFRTLAQANGGGYSQIPYFAVLMLQILYLIKYKSRDSQTALGRGFVDGNSAGVATGGTITKGVDFGETLGKQQMKFLNIEDFWGNYYYWLDGLVTDSSYNLLYSNDNFNDSGTGYEKFTTGLSTSIAGYIDDVWGNTETGFIIKSKNGSATTHFCDSGNLSSGLVAYFGGDWNEGSNPGFARLQLDNSASSAGSPFAARLFYA